MLTIFRNYQYILFIIGLITLLLIIVYNQKWISFKRFDCARRCRRFLWNVYSYILVYLFLFVLSI